MKQRIGSVLRRLGSGKSAAAKADAPEDGGDKLQGRIRIIEPRKTPARQDVAPSSVGKVIDIASRGEHGAAATVSTLTNDRPEATMETTEKLLPLEREDCEYSVSARTTFSGDRTDAGVNLNHLSVREQMWYKNQSYLLAKQKEETPPRRSKVSSRYAANDRGVDRYAAGINRHRDSPRGVNEVDDEFESTNMYKNVRRGGDSRKEVRFRSQSQGRSSLEASRNDDEDTQTCQSDKSSSLFDEEDETCTKQSSSLFDDEDDTRTNQSSSLAYTDASESNFDEVSLGSVTAGSATLDETTLAGESFLTSLDDGTSSPYRFVLDDDGTTRRRKYKLGVGQNPNASRPRQETKKEAAASKEGTSPGRRVTVHAPRGRRGKGAASESDFTDDEAVCPLLPSIMEEVSGTCSDAKSALDQVLYAFFISEDDVDTISDKLRDAKLEIAEMYQEQKEKRKSSRCVRSGKRETLL